MPNFNQDKQKSNISNVGLFNSIFFITAFSLNTQCRNYAGGFIKTSR